MTMIKNNLRKMHIRGFDLEVKALKDDGKFTGYGAVFGNVDSYKDIVAPGAFAGSLAKLKAQGRAVPILWQHRGDEPIGVWTSLSEDDHGLKGDGDLWLDEAPYARIAYKGMQANAITGLSIGYRTIRESYNQKTGINTLEELDLVECSIVTNPANDEARIDAIKSLIAHGALPTEPEFEKFLRDAGFSKTQSTVITGRGLRHLLRSDSEDAASHDDIKAALAVINKFEFPQF